VLGANFGCGYAHGTGLIWLAGGDGGVVVETLATAGGGGDDGGTGDGASTGRTRVTAQFAAPYALSGPATLDDVKARYINTLIAMLEEKGKAGEMDEALMGRIEKLLQIQ
jgi:hypothetical protein